MPLSRRTLLQYSAAAAATSTLTLTSCADSASNMTEPDGSSTAGKLLGRATDLILDAYPESTSSAGIDTGTYSGHKSRLTDRSPEGQAAIERNVRAMLTKLNKVDTSALPADEALNVEVVRTVFDMSAQGFDLPYGDMALLNSNWSYRNSPYAVAQNTGAFVEIPSFLDSSHSLKTAEDAEAYLARMEAYAGQLDGETERTKIAGDQGVILPDFLMAKTLAQLRNARARKPESWGLVKTLADKWDGQYAGQATTLASEQIGPAIDRQIAVHDALAPKANSDAGVWAKPDGDAYYDWALRAGTTTTMSPDDVHQMGLEELASLQARMEPILQSIGYTQGTVGDRMTALGKDEKYRFKEGDPGRAEIMAFINDAMDEIRGLMPQAFETLGAGFPRSHAHRPRSGGRRAGRLWRGGVN